MGGTKQDYMEHLERMDKAVGILVRAGVLKRCDLHEDIVFEGGNDIEDAYRLGNARFSEGKYRGVFETRKQMTDAIKQAERDNFAFSCGRCDKDD